MHPANQSNKLKKTAWPSHVSGARRSAAHGPSCVTAGWHAFAAGFQKSVADLSVWLLKIRVEQVTKGGAEPQTDSTSED